jgi:hypothetical protein
MKRRSGYRLYIWSVILSAVLLAAILVFTSLRILRADREFSRLILEENKQFLINTLRSSHGIMTQMQGFRYDDLIQLALKSRFIRYLALLDEGGNVLAQSKPISGVPLRDSYDTEQLSDGTVLHRAQEILLISYKAHKGDSDTTAMGYERMAGARIKEERPVGWYIVAMDVSVFEKHYHDTVVQSLAAAGAIFLLGALALVFLGIVQRYELTHLSLERLQKIKRTLANFVPATARDLIEANPDIAVMEKVVEDATVLFLDIEGFTHLVQRYPLEVINRNIESYFSCFYHFIQNHEGDINETAGDGMMVIFLHPDPVQHALNAVSAAQKIRMRFWNGPRPCRRTIGSP